MALTIYRGYTLTDGLDGNYNYTTLNALVASATVTSIPMSAFATGSHVVLMSSTTPSSDQGDGSLWWDLALGVLRTKNGNARWDCAYRGPEMQNTTGSTLPKGMVVVPNGAGTIAPCATGMWTDTIGVLTATLVNNASGLVQAKGVCNGLVIGPTTVGDVLISAGHAVFAFGDGYMRSIGATGATTATLGVPVGMCFSQIASGTTGLATCMMWR